MPPIISTVKLQVGGTAPSNGSADDGEMTNGMTPLRFRPQTTTSESLLNIGRSSRVSVSSAAVRRCVI